MGHVASTGRRETYDVSKKTSKEPVERSRCSWKDNVKIKLRVWASTGPSSGHLATRQWSLWFHKRRKFRDLNVSKSCYLLTKCLSRIRGGSVNWQVIIWLLLIRLLTSSEKYVPTGRTHPRLSMRRLRQTHNVITETRESGVAHPAFVRYVAYGAMLHQGDIMFSRQNVGLHRYVTTQACCTNMKPKYHNGNWLKEMGGVSSTHERDELCIYLETFSRQIRRKKTTCYKQEVYKV